MNSPEFNKKVRWVRRRARRLMAFYGVSRALAIFDARIDWIDLNLPATGARRHG